MIEIKDIVLLLFGIAAGIVSNYLFKHLDQAGGSDSTIEMQLVSKNQNERSNASRKCLLIAAKWYLIANIFWVVSGSIWALDFAVDQLVVRIVLAVSSLIAILYFWLALRWVVRAFKGFGVVS